ncbi:MAG: protein phosphatase 2C domain-containing protein [Cyanobacteria bacterium P01_A01_bin.123]
MPYQYLWAVGNAWKRVVQDQHLGNRYRWLHSNVFLDLQPDQPPEPVVDLPVTVLPYLRLSGYSRHIPRPYTVLTGIAEQPLETPIVLLDQAAIAPSPAIDTKLPRLLPTLAEQWPKMPPLAQLNGLWQLASLWEPLRSEQVVSTLLTPDLIRLDGTLVRVLELCPDSPDVTYSLAALADYWQPLISKAHTAVAPYLQSLCQRLKSGEYKTSEQLLVSLERGLRSCGADQQTQVQIATRTDQGPTRKRNEDACFPANGTAITYGEQSAIADRNPDLPPIPLVLVCDGIGGHEGGDVASSLAIQSIQRYLMPLLKTATPDPDVISQALGQAICIANDEISQRNDLEKRQAQGRMGTTVVAALVVGESLYLAHLGDSRAYRITSKSCRQITVDDDVASREVRLGYGLYREALYHPGAGSLVQALGMTSSKLLYPTVQRFVLDEDFLVLLCSDGLSDNDVIENTWHQSLLPILQGQQLVAGGSQALVQLANTQNGHDNVTIGLLKFQVIHVATTPVDPALAVPPAMAPQDQSLTTATAAATPMAPAATLTPPSPRTPQPLVQSTTQVPVKAQSRGKSWGLITLGFAGLGAIIGIITFNLLPELLPATNAELPTLFQSAAPPLLPPTPFADTPSIFEINRLLQVTVAVVDVNGVAQPLRLYAEPNDLSPTGSPNSTNPEKIEGTLPAGSILQVLNQREVADQPRWVRLKVCSVPSGASLGDRPTESNTPTAEVNPVAPGTLVQLSQPGDEGWISATTLAPVVQPLGAVAPAQQGDCQP